MRCDDALAAISLRADGELAGGDLTETDLDAHVAGCAACAGFAADVRHVRSRLRVEPIDDVPDLGPAVVAALRTDRRRDPAGRAADDTATTPAEPAGATAPARGRSDRRRLAVAATVAALAGMAAGATFVGLGTEPRSPAAADVPALVVAAQHDIDAVDSRFTITERVADAGDRRERTFDGRLVYRSPESLALSIHETTSAVAEDDRVEGRLVVDGARDRWWQETARRCADAAVVRCPDGTVSWVRSVTGREPFSAAAPVPLDLVSPVDSFTLSATPSSLGERTIAGHHAVGVEVTAAQVAPLIDGLSAAIELAPVHPADRVALWLDDRHLVPLEVTVRAADDPARTRWASTVGAAAPPGEVVLAMTATDVRINGPVDDGALRIPADDAATGPGHLDTGDAGFRPTPPDDPAVADVPAPRRLPAGFEAHRSGSVATPGGPPVGVRSWSDGRAWLTVRATTAWTGGRLFGDLGPDVRPVDLGTAGTAYAGSAGGRVGLHADGLDVVVEGSLPPDRLQAVAADLGVRGLPVPAGWVEAATADLADAADAVPGLLTARRLDGFGDPAVRVAEGAGGATVTQVFAGPGQRAFTLTQRQGGLLPPPSVGDETGVDVRGTPGRHSQRGGELEWVEGGTALSLRSDTLTLADLLDIARRLEPVA